MAQGDAQTQEEVDFSDPAQLLIRQKKILEAINNHTSKERFDPLKILRKSPFGTYAIILCHGGKFALQVYEGSKCIFTRSDSKYVVRKKQGGRQINADRSKKIMSSTGSQMRRENEKLLSQHIEDFM